MKVLVVGLGSMGKRRIRLMKELYPEFTICGVDTREDRRKDVAKLFSITTYNSIDSIDEDVDCAFVCTSPLSHSKIITECLMRKWDVFTELNLVADGYDENMRLAETNDCKLFLSSTFLYREEIRYISSKTTKSQKWDYIYHVGQYLPDWHPWENYKDFFVGDKRTNGCREIMAIELPWLVESFGEIIEVKAISDKMTGLNVTYNDNYIIQLKHTNGNKGVLIVDIVSPYAVRKFEAFGEHRYISWNGTSESLFEFCPIKGVLVPVALYEKQENEEGYQKFIAENAYRNEIREFFGVVQDGKHATYGFKEDKKILRLIDDLEALS